MKRIYIYLVRRIFLYAIIFLMSLTAFFFVLNLVPGDPVTRYVEEMRGRYGYSIPTTDKLIKEYEEAFGLDKALFPRYISYMKQLLLKQNFGPSFLAFPKPAQELIFDALPWSIGLLGVSVIVAWILGILLGTFVGWERGTTIDASITPLGLVASQIPTYLLALLLAMGLAYGLAIFPTSGAYSALVERGFNLRFIGSLLYHGVLPSLSLVLVYIFGWMISQRALVVNILGEDYMRFAEAKGLKNSRLINRYVLRNTLLPQTTGLALSLGFIVNGFFLIEWIFRYPGIGSLFLNAIRALDYNVLLGSTVVTMFCVLTANLIIELLYPLIDPRIRRGQ
ncbi:MAG: ABC transporter permease [bacterium]